MRLRYPVIALKGEFTHRLRVDLHDSLHDEALNPTNEVGFMTTAFAMVERRVGCHDVSCHMPAA
jgi:hypothetical protein